MAMIVRAVLSLRALASNQVLPLMQKLVHCINMASYNEPKNLVRTLRLVLYNVIIFL